MFKFRISNEFKELSMLQLTGMTEDDCLNLCISEYNLFKDYIKSPTTVLELGCGLGRMSIFLNSELKNEDIHYILADSTFDNNSPEYGWKANKGYYNDLELTRKFSERHGLTNFEVIDLEKDNFDKFKEVDLVMSFLSVGFHYPVEDYVDNIMKISSNNCICIFGVRRNKYSEKYFEDYFNDIKLIENKFCFNGKRIKEDILILEGKKYV